MPNGYERVEGARGTPGQTYKADFTINDTTSKQYKFGGTLAPVTMEVTGLSGINGRTLAFYDAAGLRTLGTCDNSVSMDDSTATVIGVSDTNTLAKLATSINNFLNVAATQGPAEFTATVDGTEFTITRKSINNGVVSITSDAIGGTLVDNDNVELGSEPDDNPDGNSLKGVIPNQQAPFSVGIKGPSSLRGRSTPYKVTK